MQELKMKLLQQAKDVDIFAKSGLSRMAQKYIMKNLK
jgi:hypothetical protein